ncbi:g7855 [Coccomyxa viridis]|uniref:G7855 protein n=1 Tax=Coccomyxa viridis TaxID=1274662 RepID=A0ABP1G5L6_9CHLO
MARRRTVYGNEELQTLSRLTLSDGFNMIRGDALIRTKQDSTSPDGGALVVSGGVGIGMTLNVGGGLSVQCGSGQGIALGSPNIVSGLSLYSQLQTDIVPYDDSVESLGNASRRWSSAWVDSIVNPGPILIHSTSTDPDVGVQITNLQLQGNFAVAAPAHFMSSVLVDGPTHLNMTSVDTTQVNFSVIGPGNFNVEAPSFNVHCNELTLNCTDTVKGVSIATENDGVPFFFGNQNSTCTFNGKFVLVRGDLQVMGNTTTINSQIVDIEDHQIELGVIADPNDATADGGGIILKGSTDKTLTWSEATGLWTFNTGVAIQAGDSLHADAISGQSVGLTLSDGSTNLMTLLNGRVGIKAAAPTVTLHIGATDAIHIPVGSTVQRPNSAIVQTGMVRYNTDLHRYEGYTQAGAWSSLGGVVDQQQTTYITVESDDNTTDVHRIRFFVQGSEVSNFDPSGRLGLGTTTPAVRLDIRDTDAVHIPVGSTAQRPNSTIVQSGMIRYNTDLHRYEGYTQADGSEVSNFDPSGRLGLGTTTPAVRLDIQDTDAVHIPVGSTLQRPNSAIAQSGMVRYNTDLHRYEGYTEADVWGSLGGVIDQAQTTYITVESDDNTTDVHRIRFFVQGVEVSNFDPTGKLGLGTTTPAVRLDIQDTDAVHIPVGSTAQRPNSTIVQTGMIRYNTDLHSYEGYRDGGAWADLDGLRDIEGTTYATVLSDDRSSDTHSIRYVTNGSQVAVMDASGNLGIGTPSPVCQLHLTSTDAVLLPIGTSAQRPNATSQEGMIRYNADRRNFEGMRLVGTPTQGLDCWVSMSGVSNDTDTTFITVHDPTTGSSLDEIRFYTNAQIVNDTVISGLRFKIDQSGNFGIGGAQDRVLSSLLDVMGTENEQFLLSYDSNNYTALTTNTHGFTLQNYAQDAVDYGDITLLPAGPLRKVVVGNSTDVYSPGDIPIKLTVYGYVYASGGIRYPDGSIQTTSSTQSSSGAAYGQWALGQVSTGVEKYYQPINTTQVAIGTDTPLAKLSIAKVSGEAANLPHLELRYTQNDYATLQVEANGSLFVTSGLGEDSDIPLQPTGNVCINVGSAVASLHVDHDLYLQGSNDPDNTYTGMGLYMRFNTASNQGLIASGNNATSTPYPLTIQASQLGVSGGLSVGSTFASASPPSNGAIVQEHVGVATSAPLASLDVGTTSSIVVIRASQHDQTIPGIVVANASASAAPADGLKVTTLNTGDATIDAVNYTGVKHLQLNPSGGPVSVCGTLSDAQLSVSQAGTASSIPVVSMHQASTQAPIFKMTGGNIPSNTTTNIVMNDANVTNAKIGAYVQVTVLDSAGNLPSVPYYMPLYTLT